VFESVFREKDGIVYYDLPVDGRFRAKELSLRADASLGRNATVRLTVTPADARRRTIAVRIPEWAADVKAALPGLTLAGTPRQGYLELERVWKSGDVVTIRYTMRTRLLPADKPASSVAVLYGPWLLAVDESASAHYFDEPSSQNQVLLPASGEIKLEAAGPAGRTATPFDVPVAHFKLKYLPGGYPIQPATALLRPMAEFTNGPDSNRLDFWLPVKAQVEKLDSNY
jgi:DUF1680 family protein